MSKVDLDGLYKEVEKHLANTHVAHGMDHAVRTAKLARHIAQAEGFDPLEAEVTGLLHDIGRSVQKEAKDHGAAGVPLAGELISKFTDYDEATKQRMLDAIRDHSEFKAEGELTHILQDADKLDGLGAVGLARFYSSKARLPMYDPAEIVPKEGARDTNIHAQVVWALEWLNMMETDTGRELAKKRGQAMVDFMRQIEAEVHGKDF